MRHGKIIIHEAQLLLSMPQVMLYYLLYIFVSYPQSVSIVWDLLQCFGFDERFYHVLNVFQ